MTLQREEKQTTAHTEKYPLLKTKDQEFINGANMEDKSFDKNPQTGKSESEDNVSSAECCYPATSVGKVVLTIAACGSAGIVFGWCMEKSRVFEPETIRMQMVFERWIMLKMFLAAMSSGQFILGVLSVLPRTKQRFEEAFVSFGGCFAEKGLLASCLGPFVLGIGMTLSGACPGMVLPQVGSWTKNSIYTLLGGLLGALTYGLLATQVIRFTKPAKPLSSKTVQESLEISYWKLALPSCLFLLLVVFLMEWFIPWQDDVPLQARNGNNTNIITVTSWPPSVSGIIIGLLQLVIVLAVADTLGGSSSYQTIVSQWVVGPTLAKTFPYMAKYRCGIGNWWQVVYVLCAMLGGFLSALASDTLATTKGVSVPTAVIGGFLLIVGARFAAGCTSGHGLSGAALFYWLSLVAVPSMFAGGIMTGFSMKATGALDHYDCFEPC